ncbi:uncharacterized protein LOC144369407 [Ictidomys tridecemlineatus]
MHKLFLEGRLVKLVLEEGNPGLQTAQLSVGSWGQSVFHRIPSTPPPTSAAWERSLTFSDILRGKETASGSRCVPRSFLQIRVGSPHVGCRTPASPGPGSYPRPDWTSVCPPARCPAPPQSGAAGPLPGHRLSVSFSQADSAFSAVNPRTSAQRLQGV